MIAGTTNSLIADIRFWIIAFFFIRLFAITNPPLEVAHNWRQTTVTMVARNFVETDANILYPRLDIGGEKTGITGMEFPLLNYSIYVVSKIFGYNHWYGRLINLIVSSFGLYFFYLLIRKYFKKEVAFSATIILLFSIWFSYSRKIMPDTFSMSFVIAGLYFGCNYLDKSKNYFYLFLFFIFTLAGVLSKLPSAFILVVLIPFFVDEKVSIKQKIIPAALIFMIMIIASAWYFLWVPRLVNTYGLQHFFMGKSILTGFEEIRNHLPETLKRFYDSPLKYVGFFLFLFGLVIMIKSRQKLPIFIFVSSLCAFLLVVLKSGWTFTHHSYYIIPFAPVMALVAGYGYSVIKNKKIAVFILVLIGTEGVLTQYHDFIIRDKEGALLNLENDLDKISSTSDLILINSGESPTPMYFAHRKGWINYNTKVADDNYVKELQQKGLKFIVTMKKTFGEPLELPYDKALNNEHYSIYRLD